MIACTVDFQAHDYIVSYYIVMLSYYCKIACYLSSLNMSSAYTPTVLHLCSIMLGPQSHSPVVDEHLNLSD